MTQASASHSAVVALITKLDSASSRLVTILLCRCCGSSLEGV